MESVVGGIKNKFAVRSRRVTLFFEGILADYIKECEKAGYGDKIYDIGKKWGRLVSYSLGTKALKHLPPSILLKIAKKM